MFITVEWPESNFQSPCVRVSELLSVLSLLIWHWIVNKESPSRTGETENEPAECLTTVTQWIDELELNHIGMSENRRRNQIKLQLTSLNWIIVDFITLMCIWKRWPFVQRRRIFKNGAVGCRCRKDLSQFRLFVNTLLYLVYEFVVRLTEWSYHWQLHTGGHRPCALRASYIPTCNHTLVPD